LVFKLKLLYSPTFWQSINKLWASKNFGLNNKKMKRINILLFGIILISGCGKWPDNIKLSVKDVEFGRSADSIIITTKGNSWWIDGISLIDTTYYFYNDESIDIFGNSFKIEKDFFIVEKLNKTKLSVTVNENTTGKERFMRLTFQAGDYFDYIRINQLAE